MSIWLLLQIALNIFLFLGLWLLWTKLRRPAKDDPRLSKGLQLLQSKIAVIEDLSDKTDTQVSQLAALLEKKCREIQNKMHEADQCMSRIEQSVEKSLDVASIFEDRIPHQEIIDRQRTKAYVKAAQLAHQGLPIDEIAEQVDLNRGELEMIVKVNRDRLMFSQEDLPTWAREEVSEESPSAIDFNLKNKSFVGGTDGEIQPDLSNVFKPIVKPPESLGQLGEEFRKACEEYEEQEEQVAVESATEKVFNELSTSAVNQFRRFSQTAKEKLNNIQILDGDRDRTELLDEINKLTSPLEEIETSSEPESAQDKIHASETPSEGDGLSVGVAANQREGQVKNKTETNDQVKGESITSKKIVRSVDVQTVVFPKIESHSNEPSPEVR